MSNVIISQLIRSNRRSISLEVDASAKLIVKAPFFMPMGLINRFVTEKQGWIVKQIEKRSKHPKIKKQYIDGEEFLFLGNVYKLTIGNHKEIAFSDKGELHFPRGLTFRIQKELERFYIKQAKEIIIIRVEYHAKLMNLNYNSILFSDTRSKWGTCTSKNCLQFNWRLILAPLIVVDYVIVHELTHIKEKNHSRKFWSIVGSYKPAYRQHRKWLNENAHKLVI